MLLAKLTLRLALTSLLGWAVATQTLYAGLQVKLYPAPAQASRSADFVAVYPGPDPQLASPFYGVAVTQNGSAQESFTYISRSLDPADAKIRGDVIAGISAIGMPNVTVYDCFFQCNDDGIYVSPQGVHIHDCTFWHNDNGSPFQFNWGGNPITLGGGFIHDCDVIHFGVTRENNNRVVFGSRKSGPGDIVRVRFRDIRVEGPVWRLFRINTYYSNSGRNAGQPAGSIRDVVFENIACSGPQLNPSEIVAQEKAPAGAPPNASRVERIVFRNVTIQGRPLTQEDLLPGKTNVSGIVVENPGRP